MHRRRFALLAIVVACDSADDPPAKRDGGIDAATSMGGSDAAAGGAAGSLGCGDAAACLERRHATWPMPNPGSLPLPNPASWMVGGESAIEAVTGLEWQRAFTPKLTWADAMATCDALVAAGRDDWRLPSRIELISLVDFTRRPTIDAAAFDGTPEDYFWASTVTSFDPTLAWSVYFGAGFSAYGARTGITAHARCVRGGRVVSRERWQISAEEVRDPNTGLVWQRAHHPDRLIWDAAGELCAALRIAGRGPWRLPTTNEAQTLVDETRSAPAIDVTVFPDTPVGRFWTASTTNRANSTEAVYFDTNDGATEESSKHDALWVRCVR